MRRHNTNVSNATRIHSQEWDLFYVVPSPFFKEKKVMIMRILFCNIAWMNYYKGIIWGKDEPQNGGSEESGYPKGEYCLGFVETKSTNK